MLVFDWVLILQLSMIVSWGEIWKLHQGLLLEAVLKIVEIIFAEEIEPNLIAVKSEMQQEAAMGCLGKDCVLNWFEGLDEGLVLD